MKRTSLQYAAGFIDGEGTITVHSVTSRGTLLVYPVLQVANTHKKVVLVLQNTFGGKVYVQKSRPLSPKQQWVWVLYGTKVIPFLKRVYPHLIVKKKITKLVLTGAVSKNRSLAYVRRWLQTVRRQNGR